MTKIRSAYLEKFQRAYQELNEQQKKAVDQIEGPVMVIAGPGTGKTQLLAIRTGNILLNTDVFPHNILCLTYTDGGSIAMRNRLQEFIGPDAHNVHIHTFHAFCNMVIKENMQYFGDFRDLQTVSEIEEIEIYRTLIDELPDNHELKRLKGDIYYDIRRLKNLFATMKKENWTAKTFHDAFEDFRKIITDKDHPGNEYLYKRRTKNNATGDYFEVGDLKITQIESELEKYSKVVSAAELIDTYNAGMLSKERYDYADMILWVIKMFNENEQLLAVYQERFQYILVDEYQDTNGAQNDLLFLLADYWEESPNLFIVGDDDQSIFRFQGANMNNILDFKNKYNPIEIVLTDNYRSSQLILDRAKNLIENNDDRLVKKYDYLIKDLIEKRPKHKDLPVEPTIIAYDNITQEEVGIIQKIMQLNAAGTPLNEIAVLYTKHSLVENMVQYLTSKHIPLNVKKRVNILHQPEIEKLINILEYIWAEHTKAYSAEDRLFELMHYHYFGIPALDIAKISIYLRRINATYKDQQVPLVYWREVIGDVKLLESLNLQNVGAILQLSRITEVWISDISNLTVQTLFEKILTEGNILNHALQSEDRTWNLQLLNTFFDYIKNEAAKKKVYKIKDLLTALNVMEESGLELPVNRIISNVNGVHFMTAYGSKGLEFEHVFIMRANKKLWEDKTGNNNSFSYPPTLIGSSEQGHIEDDRRLFYVAMTRAKHYLYISFAKYADDEKEMEISRFVSETIWDEREIINENVNENDILEYTSQLMRYQSGTPQLLDDDQIDRVLENFKMSSTNLNKYLKCKLAFYFETILRVPQARSRTMGFGNAVHYAFEMFFRDIKKSSPRSYGSVMNLKTFFIKGMESYRSHFTSAEYENYTKYGSEILESYYENYKNEWLTIKDYEIELDISSSTHSGVPISGKLDRVDIYDHHVVVTDYKTGNFDSKKLKPPTGDETDLGGDYWRQIVFYRLLLESDTRQNRKMQKGIMDFVEKEKDGRYKRGSIEVGALELEIVGNQLLKAYEDIKNHIFTPGCGDAKCQWCNFVNKNMPISLTVSEESEDSQNVFDLSDAMTFEQEK